MLIDEASARTIALPRSLATKRTTHAWETIKHVARFLGLLFAAFATSLVILAVGGAQPKAGIALFVIGAIAALGLFLLLAHSTRPTGVQTEPNKPLAMQGRRSP